MLSVVVVSLSFVVIVHFHILLQNHLANFKQNKHGTKQTWVNGFQVYTNAPLKGEIFRKERR